MDRIVEVPAPIGKVFCHIHRNGTVEHHEAPWEGLLAECRLCGMKAVLSFTPLEKFLEDKDLVNQLVTA